MDRFTVSEDDDGRRLDKVIRALWPWLPLGAMMKAFRKKQVRVDGAGAHFDMRVAQGQEVVVPWEPRPKASVPEGFCPGPLKTLYRDGSLWIVDKPAGLLSQPDAKGGDSVVTRAWNGREGFRPKALHRLDRNTSGVMVLALTGKALRDLSDLWRKGRVEKTYLALVMGEVLSSGSIDLPLLKNSKTNQAEVNPKGKKALTIYDPLARGKGCTLCKIRIATGRSHQIRVHMACMGHPVAGDVKYGPGNPGVKRPMLHADSISFPWPGAKDGVLTATAPLPKDMTDLLRTRGVVKYTHA